MPRLIDADALGIVEDEKEAYNEFVAHSKKYGNTSSQTYFYLKGRSDGLIDASGRVKFAPTIDAVPVVRCEACWFRPKGNTYCTELGRNTGDDFYCAFGQRREDVNE